MEDVARYVERVLVMDHGRVVYDGTPREVFSHDKKLAEMGLDIPEPSKITKALNEAGLAVDTGVLTVEEACNTIYEAIKRR